MTHPQITTEPALGSGSPNPSGVHDSVSNTLRISDMVTPRRIPPGSGWRKFLYACSFRRINPGESPRERHRRELRERAKAELLAENKPKAKL